LEIEENDDPQRYFLKGESSRAFRELQNLTGNSQPHWANSFKKIKLYILFHSWKFFMAALS
jgi:hypothetical protein